MRLYKTSVRKGPSARQWGVGLVEVMVTVMIVALGTTAILSLLSVASTTSTFEQERSRANQIICQCMEQNVIFPPLPEISSGTTVTVWDNGTPADTSDDTMGTIEVIAYDMKTGNKVTSIPVNPLNRVRYRVEVTMSWHPRGALHSKTMRETVMTYKVA